MERRTLPHGYTGPWRRSTRGGPRHPRDVGVHRGCAIVLGLSTDRSGAAGAAPETILRRGSR